MTFLEIDGSVLEGGGQILRNSISLSAILGVPVHIFNIRAGRKNPGLAAQHLKGIQLITKMSQGLVKGDSIGSTEIKFLPGKLRGGNYVVDTKTAGSTSLLLQVALPCALMADQQVRLDLIGGTNADMAPPIDYMDKIFKPMLQKFKADFSLKIYKRGYFPRGGGHVTIHVDPVSYLQGADITEFGSILSIRGDSFVAGTLPMKLAYQMSDAARQELAHLPNVNIRVYKEDRNLAPDNCSGIMLSCETTSGCVLGGNALGRRGAEAHAVGVEAATPLRAAIESTACLDQYAQDQVILYMALAKGKSAIKCGEITLHTKTAMHIAERIAKTKFTIQQEGELNIIECTGVGYINRSVTPLPMEVPPSSCR